MGVIYYILSKLVTLYYMTFLVRIIISWIPEASNSKFGRIVFDITEPVLAPTRRLIDKILNGKTVMIDLSPIAVMLGLMFIGNILDILAMGNLNVKFYKE